MIRELERDAAAALKKLYPLQVQRWARTILRSPIPDGGLVEGPAASVQFGRDTSEAGMFSLPSVPHQRAITENPHQLSLTPCRFRKLYPIDSQSPTRPRGARPNPKSEL